MHLAGQAFDSAYRGWSFENDARREAFRSVVRLAALCHDLGHSPFSHCTEFAMPPLADLGLGFYGTTDGRRATHEDYTIAILEHTTLDESIQAHFPFSARHVAGLISSDVVVLDDFFVDGGLNHRRALSQIISSELDVDRMDYLVRDSYYTGARYGQIDVGWLLSNLAVQPDGNELSLALDASAIYAFDDFMIARHHMFLMVYFHHKSVIYEELLKRWVTSPSCTWSIPASIDEYLTVDDISLEAHLRQTTDRWARMVVERRPFQRVLERHGAPQEVDLEAEATALRAAGIDTIYAGSTGKLSRYNIVGQKRERAPTILVLERSRSVSQVSTIGEATQIFNRYADARRLARLYVAREEVEQARAVLDLR